MLEETPPTPSPQPTLAPGATPTPTPSESPSPTPSPTPAPTPGVPAGTVIVPVRTVAEEILQMPGIRGLPYKSLLITGVEITLLIVLYFGFRRVTRRVIQQATEAVAHREEAAGNAGRAIRLRTLGRIGDALLLWVIGFGFGVTILSTVGVNVAAIIGTASVAGIAFGFGAQKLAKDIITGFFILLEDQYAVGELVTIGSVSGVVEDLGLRTTRLKDSDGKIYYLSNGDIGQVCNHSRAPIRGSFTIAIGPGADLDAAKSALEQALAITVESLGLPGPPRVDGVVALEAAKTTLNIVFHLPPGKRPDDFTPDLREIARQALLDAGIALG